MARNSGVDFFPQTSSSSNSRPAARTTTPLELATDRVQVASPLAFWWLDPATVYALGLAAIAFVYIGFAVADDEASLAAAIDRLGTPAVVKTRRWGYDGKGQAVVRSPDEAPSAWQALGVRPLIVEGFVRFDRELSILAVRSADGRVACWPLFENHHEGGVLRRSLAPALVTTALAEQAERIALRILEGLNYVGVVGIELAEWYLQEMTAIFLGLTVLISLLTIAVSHRPSRMNTTPKTCATRCIVDIRPPGGLE